MNSKNLVFLDKLLLNKEGGVFRHSKYPPSFASDKSTYLPARLMYKNYFFINNI